jgi:glycosyltransferase involved in cell wall biosynthesis
VTGSTGPRRWNGVDVVQYSAGSVHGGIHGFLGQAARTVRTLNGVDAATFVQRSAGVATCWVGVAAKLRRRRFVYSSSSTVDFAFASLQPRAVLAWIFHAGIRLADEIVVQTDEQAALCRDQFRRVPTVIPSAVPLDGETAESPGDAFVWVGRPAPYKNPLAFLELAEALPEARFRMVGISETAGASRAFLARAAAIPNLEIVPPVSPAEAMAHIKRAVAVVNTSDYEGMPNTLLEGWLHGVPALVFRHDPDGVVVREHLGLVAHGSPEALAAGARTLWHGRLSGREAWRHCRVYIERRHSLDAVLPRWKAVIGT